MGTIYRPPFAPYCQRKEANDPVVAFRKHWNGCWCWTLARGIDGTTGGAVHGLDEDDVRSASGKPDHGLSTDSGTLADQIRALGVLAPKGTWYSSRPTKEEFRAHLAGGGIAIMAGWESDAPASDKAYDPHFYELKNADGHSNFCQGVGDGAHVIWGNPEKPVADKEPIVPIDAALAFVWAAQNRAADRVEALLLKSVVIPDPIPYMKEGIVPTAVDPIRILDTRANVGLEGEFASGVARSFKVAGANVIPANATIIVGNVTVTEQAGGGFLAVTPTPQNAPKTSTLNFPKGDNRANAVFCAINTDGTVSITVVGTKAHVIFDVTGWFTPTV